MEFSLPSYLSVDCYIMYGSFLMNYLIICNDVSVDSHAFSRFEDDKYLFFSSFVFFFNLLFLSLIQLLGLYLQIAVQ